MKIVISIFYGYYNHNLYIGFYLNLFINLYTFILNTSPLNIVIAGHVDHGKSTVVGRLLADTNSLPSGKLDDIRNYCERNSKPFEYAFLIDALKEERTQGVTIDVARVFFRTEKRHYILIDAPGHIEFLKNMVTGASKADAALLVIDAQEGVRENSRRHGYLIGMLGIRQLVVLVNKMDLVDYSEKVFNDIRDEYTRFLQSIKLSPVAFIPISGRKGDMIAKRGDEMPWFKDMTLVETIDGLQSSMTSIDKPFRMSVQDVYKFTRDGDIRRIIAGTIQSGTISVDDEIVFYPSGKKSRLNTIESFPPLKMNQQKAGDACGFTLTEHLYITRGEMAAKNNELAPCVATRLRAHIFWMGKNPLVSDKAYILKIGTARVVMTVESIEQTLDADSLTHHEHPLNVARHQVAHCILNLAKPIAFDCAAEIETTGRFVIVDGYEIAGGGIIQEALHDAQEAVRNRVLVRNIKWEKSTIPAEVRAERYKQKPTLVLITGKKNSGKKPLARALEKRLLDDGHLAYFLGIGNVLYGVDADIKGRTNSREEHLRRLGEVIHLILDTGAIVITTAIDLNSSEVRLIATVVEPDRVITVWVGKEKPNESKFDWVIENTSLDQNQLEQLTKMLTKSRII